MRTTLTIDDDVLLAAKAIARRQKRTAGAVISDLARQALNGRADARVEDASDADLGFVPFPRRDCIVTDEWIDRLREDEGI